MNPVEMAEKVCLAQEGNCCATELLYIRYKPFVENSVCNRKLVERINDSSLEREDVVQDILLDAISSGIRNFNLEKFMNSMKKDVDYYFKTLINFSINKWIKLRLSWKHTPHYRDSFTSSLDHKKTFQFSIWTHETLNKKTFSNSPFYIPGVYEANNVKGLSYEDSTYEYKVLRELVVEKINYLSDKFFSKRLQYREWDKHKIVSLFDLKYSGHFYQEIAEEIGVLMRDLLYFYKKVIKPAVLLVFDEVGYYKYYMKSLCRLSIETIRKEKGDEFVNSILSVV